MSEKSSHGIANQIWSLVGYCVLANLTAAELVLPSWDTNVAGSRGKVAFGDLFDARHFERSMVEEQGLLPAVIAMNADDAVRRRPLVDNRTITVRHSYIGWRIYKAMHSHTWRKRLLLFNNSSGGSELAAKMAFLGVAESLLGRIELGVYAALRAAPRIRDAARAAGAAVARGPFGCIHARVEHDMAIGWRINKAGPPPILARYLGHAARASFTATTSRGVQGRGADHDRASRAERGGGLEAASSLGEFVEVQRTPRAFVSVGRDVSAADAAMLDEQSAWGARPVRTNAASKATWNGTEASSETRGALRNVSTYTMAALIDMEICRRAAWFAGWPGSSFSRLMGAYRAIDHGQNQYFAVCPEFVARYRGDPVGHHEFCLPPGRS